LLCLDHAAMANNQFGMRLQFNVSPPIPTDFFAPAQMLGQVLAIGATVNMTRNRAAAGVGTVLLSLVAFDQIMGVVAANQATHDITILSNRDFSPFDAFSKTNQVLLQNGPSVDLSPLKRTLQTGFTRLLQVPNPADMSGL
jgi:hypothetical protein